MKESRIKKTRVCKHCKQTVWGDARKMKEHQELHDLATRMEKSGLVLASPRVFKPGEVK